jgi:hypothetical protein
MNNIPSKMQFMVAPRDSSDSFDCLMDDESAGCLKMLPSNSYQSNFSSVNKLHKNPLSKNKGSPVNGRVLTEADIATNASLKHIFSLHLSQTSSGVIPRSDTFKQDHRINSFDFPEAVKSFSNRDLSRGSK